VQDGHATLNYSLPIGAHFLTVQYSGTANLLPAVSGKRRVRQPTMTTLEASKLNTQYGEAIQFTITLDAGGLEPKGQVVLYEGENQLATRVLDASGRAVITLNNLSVGPHVIRARFVSTDLLAESSATVDVDVQKGVTSLALSSPQTEWWSTKIVAKVTSDSGAVVNNGLVTFMEGDVWLGTIWVADGSATLNLVTVPGAHTIRADYKSIGPFAESGSTLPVQVNKGQTKISVGTNTQWVIKGSEVELSATVSHVGTSDWVSGTVSFQVGDHSLGVATLHNGVATLKTSKLPVGNPVITATFAGSTVDLPRTSNAVKVTVVKGTTIDLMVVYTGRAMLSAGGPRGIKKLINDSVAGMNQALVNSRIPVLVRLVDASLVYYVESGKMKTDLKRLALPDDGFMDEVHKWRDRYKADLVSLLEGYGDAGGLGFELTDLGDDFNDARGFNIVLAQQAAAPYWSLAHELGHNLGATHDAQHAEGHGATKFSNGWRFTADGTVYHDIMSYDPGQTIPYFSNPRVKYNGVPTGTATADSARTITLTAPYVAKYR